MNLIIFFERGWLHVDTFTVLDGTLYSKIELDEAPTGINSGFANSKPFN